MARYTIYAVNTSAGVISGCQSNQMDAAVNEILRGGDGAVDAEFVALMNAEPTIGFDTVDVATALGYAGLSGLGYLSALTMYLQQLADGGTRETGSSHVTIVSAAGLLIPTSIRATQNDLATLSMIAHCKSSNGTAHPLSVTASQALAGSPAITEMFTVGPASLNGTDLGELTEIGLDFNFEVRPASAKGLPYPTAFYILTRRPVLTLRTMNAGIVSSFGPAGGAINASDVIAYLRKIDQGGARVADGTAEHVKFTIDEGRINIGTVEGADGAESSTQITVTPTYDGANDVVAINAASAIT